MDEPLEIWFKREVLAHEPALMRYLTRAWPEEHDVADIRQEAYIRVLSAALKARPQSPKAFLFTTARHLMVDRTRRARTVSIRPAAHEELTERLVDEISPEQQVSARGELSQLWHAFQLLPPRSRQVMWLRRVQDFSQREVARQLGVSEKAIEKHMRTGSRKLAELMARGAVSA